MRLLFYMGVFINVSERQFATIATINTYGSFSFYLHE